MIAHRAGTWRPVISLAVTLVCQGNRGLRGEPGAAMNEGDLALRNLSYVRFVELGRAPTAAEGLLKDH